MKSLFFHYYAIPIVVVVRIKEQTDMQNKEQADVFMGKRIKSKQPYIHACVSDWLL